MGALQVWRACLNDPRPRLHLLGSMCISAGIPLYDTHILSISLDLFRLALNPYVLGEIEWID